MQILASALILLCMINKTSLLREIVTIIALLIKIGTWPFHLWFLRLINNIEISIIRILLLITWQKLLPIMLILPILKRKESSIILIILLISRSVISIIKLKGNLLFKGVIALSSINNNSLFIIIRIFSIPIFLLYIIIYRVRLKIILKFFVKNNKKQRPKRESVWAPFLVAGNLGGVPPISIFWIKFSALTLIIESNMTIWVPLILLIIFCVFLYHYIWCALTEIIKINSKNQITLIKEGNWEFTFIILISIISIRIFFLLGLTQRGSILME